MTDIIYPENDNTKKFILENLKLEEKLHVIAVISNPCNFKIRYKLFKEFYKRMQLENNIILYVVELVYGNQPFEVTESDNSRHLQIRTDTYPLWHKENLINLGIKYLLPKNWKAVAWVDSDIEFENPHWSEDALKILNGGNDFIQLFTHAIDMDKNNQIMNTFTSFGYQYLKKFTKGHNDINYWHPGFAWACNRKAYEQIGKLFDVAILGSGDNIMCHCFIKKGSLTLKKGMTPEYIEYVEQYQNKFDGLTLGYVPGNIRHYFHGKKVNRNYYGREDILIDNKYDPNTFIQFDEIGLIRPTSFFAEKFLNDIANYFVSRNEDEDISSENITNNLTDPELKYAYIDINLFKNASNNKTIIENEIINTKIEQPRQDKEISLWSRWCCCFFKSNKKLK
jgi:hypothetical protein